MKKCIIDLRFIISLINYTSIINFAGGSSSTIGIVTGASIPPEWDRYANTESASNSIANGEYYGIIRSLNASESISQIWRWKCVLDSD